MPRQARIIPPEGFLHVISRGNNHRKLFRSPAHFNTYLYLLKKFKGEEMIKVFHYCLMPNHIHLLVGVRPESNLSRFMKRLNLTYFYRYKRKFTYSGHLWQDRFKSKLIEEEPYLIQCGKYIELNPVRAGIVRMPQDYPYSSYLHYITGAGNELVDDDPWYLDLSRNPAMRKLLYKKMIINEMVYKNLIVFDDDVTSCK